MSPDDIVLWLRPAKLDSIYLQITGGDAVELSADQAAAVASKLLVLAAVQSSSEITKVRKVVDRVETLLAGLDALAPADPQTDQDAREPEPSPAETSVLPPHLREENGSADPGAPAECATCGVTLGSWPAAVEHGRVGCKTLDTGEVPCLACGRKFATLGGLGVHRARAHPLPPPEPASPVISEHKCDLCGRMFNSAQGLGRHIPACERAAPARVGPLSRVDRLLDNEDGDGQAWEPPEPQRAGAEPEHRLADLSKRGNAWQALCSCGHTSLAEDKGKVRELFRDHCAAA